MATERLKDTICGAAIVGLSFNEDFSECAFSPNNHLVHVARCADKVDCTTWEIYATLEQHDQSVSSTAWHGPSDRILSCSHDRTAFVWCRDTREKWKPQMVLLDAGVKRGLTSCAWGHSGGKIYVGSAAANIAVGRFDSNDEWWICRLLEGHTGTVTALAPHPSNDALLASGGTDGKLFLVSTFIKKLDTQKSASFGHVYMERQFGAWVHAVAWAPSGQRLAVATHDSRVHVINVSSFSGNVEDDTKSSTLYTINLSILPLKALTFVVDDHLVGGGFDYYPVLFTPIDGGMGWRMAGKWTVNRRKGTKTAQQLARERFQNEARIGEVELLDEEHTRHRNTINSVVSLFTTNSASAAVPSIDDPVFATGSLDGRVEEWRMGEVTSL